MTTGQLAEFAGVSAEAVRKWFKQNGRRELDYRFVGNWMLIGTKGAERYLNRFGIPLGEPNKGMQKLIDVAKQLGLPKERLRTYCTRRQIHCVRYKRAIYLYKHQVVELERKRIPPGWVSVREAAETYKINRSTLIHRLHRAKKEVRYANRLAIVRLVDVLDVLDRLPAGAVPAARLAFRCGVTQSAVVKWAKAHGFKVYHGTWAGARLTHVSKECAEAYLKMRRERGKKHG